jgi:hypothetical protein
MTAAEIETLKQNIKKVMVDHLITIGYPKITNEQILRELKPMWIKIEEAGLVVPGMNFQNFAAIANHHFMIAEINDIMGI